MRILLVASHVRVPGSEGQATHVTELVGFLREHAPTLLLARLGSTGQGVLPVGHWRGIPPVGMRHLWAMTSAMRALPSVRDFAPTVIYERGASYGTGAILSQHMGVPLVASVSDSNFSALTLSRAASIVATDPSLVPERHRHKLTWIRSGANEQRFRPLVPSAALRKRFRIEPGAPVVAYAGSFQVWQGLHTLIDAVLQLPEPRPIFLVIGGGSGGKRLATRVRELGLDKHFRFAGAVAYDEVPELLSLADVCVAPFEPASHPDRARSGWQLDPLKVLEYLALGKPTVTVSAPGISELFRDGEHLRFVPPRNPQALAQAIHSLLSDRAMAERLAASGRALVLERHTWSSSTRELLQVFQSLGVR